MAYEYRVTEAADGTFPVELWSSKGGHEQLIYKTRGFQTRELAEAWIVPGRIDSMTLLYPAPAWFISSRSAHVGNNQRPHSSSASRLTAGASGFLNLSQSGERGTALGGA